MKKHEKQRHKRACKSEDNKPPAMQIVTLFERKRDRRPPVPTDYPGNKDRKVSPVLEEPSKEIQGLTVPASVHPSCGQCYTSDNRGDNPPGEDIEQYDPALLAKLERALHESKRNAEYAYEGFMGRNGSISGSEPSAVHSSVALSLGTYISSSDIFSVPPLQSYVRVKCPIQTCGGIVTGSALISHFEFEHLSVPIIRADYNATKYNITVNPTAFQDYNVQCLAIFLVPNELPVSPSVVKMATTRMGQIRLMKRSMVCLVLASKFTYIPPKHSGSKGDGAENFFLVWATCLYEEPPIYYTIEAANSNQKLCTMKYCGPIGTLHESQNPNEVFRRGNCLVVNPGLLRSLSNPSGNVEISVSFHPVYY